MKRLYLQNKGLPREVMCEFATLDPIKEEWYTTDHRIERLYHFVPHQRKTKPLHHRVKEVFNKLESEYSRATAEDHKRTVMAFYYWLKKNPDIRTIEFTTITRFFQDQGWSQSTIRQRSSILNKIKNRI